MPLTVVPLDQSLNADILVKNSQSTHKSKQYKALKDLLSKKSTWTLNERVADSGLIIANFSPEQQEVFRKHISQIVDKKLGDKSSLPSAREISDLFRFFEDHPITLIISEIHYIFAAMDFISYALVAPKYSEVLMSYGVLAVALAVGDKKHLDKDITKHCKYHDTLKKIASNLSSSSFSSRYLETKNYAMKLAMLDVLSSKLEEKLQKSAKLKEYIGIKKALNKFQEVVEGSISTVTLEPLSECLKKCNINITNMLQKVETLKCIALLQHPDIQAIFYNPLYQEEIEKDITHNKSDDNSDLIEKIYTTPTLKDIRQVLKNISPDGHLNGTMVKEMTDKACEIKKRERFKVDYQNKLETLQLQHKDLSIF